MQKYKNKIICGDCIELLGKVKAPFADLVFADPPFNIGYQYDKYKDKLKSDKYIRWTEDWMTACLNALKPDASFYIAIGDEYAANVKLIGDKLGLTLRNWIIWHYSFGQQTKTKFARSHTHIFYFVKDENNFFFNDEQARIISDRQKKYKDKRANPAGKMPDDVWNVYPRICGTFEEREGWHPCQMPESLLARIIRVSSKDKDANGMPAWILDPFSGSGTTCVVAHKLNRIYTGIDISPNYAKETRKRIKESEGLPIEGESPPEWNSHLKSELKWMYHENSISVDQLNTEEHLLAIFTTKFNMRIGQKTNPFTPKDISEQLLRLRKGAKLGPKEKNNFLQ
jgi:site-specific DNA-methyltransferase (adenine-specific)